ncbi:hypothetical protein GCM10007079_30540 [Nocardiopsis terrae]|uniref:Lactonase, 7-bladed beta-propeller n=1 Tax=Nocardiopsis terrae TaxID=372655 RepID=A0ABR9HIQ6_9ACTN|nr:hypothetical protein [Nocardiopsis terrae]MBE1458882.1 hypothetical protein [Nocardiopsis terrae]GHC86889.1 hypothetical protein GCM10007079_30540 [Nocardiopsis terrae]
MTRSPTVGWKPDGLTILELNHSGDSNFAIWAYTNGDQAPTVNAIGPLGVLT